MAKAKDADDPKRPKGKYSDQDVAEFVAALRGDDEETVTPATDEPKAKDGPRKIRVRPELDTVEPTRPSAAKPDGAAAITDVLGHQPPEEMQRLKKVKRSGFRWGLLIGIIGLLAAVSVAGFFFFNRTKRFTNNNVQLQFADTPAAVSGSDFTITVEYQNLEPVDLTKVELTIEYPDGFTYTKAKPEATGDFHNSFDLGTIRSGQAGSVAITGTLIGAVGETRSFNATLTYTPATFNSEFQQRVSTDVKIDSSILGLVLAGPNQLAPGGSGTWTVTYTNTSDHDLKEATITATYPEGFTPTKTTPTASEGSTVWTLSNIKKGDKGTITIVGTINGNLGDSFPLKVSAGIPNDTKALVLQDEQSLLIILIKTGVTTTVAVNGSTDPLVIDPSEKLNYTIRVSNASDNEVTNATVTVKLEGQALDMATLANDLKAKVDKQTLTWTKDQVAALGDLKPSQSVTLTFSVGTVSPLTMKADEDRDQRVTATVNVASASLSSSTNTGSQPSTVVVTKIATVMKLEAEARYYDEQGVPLGSGPIPPVAGKTTTYRIIWRVTNTTSDANELVVTARLPNSVLWTGQQLARDAGDLTFDPATRTVRWSINVLPAGTGSRLPTLSARFDVSITPTPEHVGTVPVLLEASSAAATDEYTNKALSSTSSTLSTDVPTDAQAGGEGRVRSAE